MKKPVACALMFSIALSVLAVCCAVYPAKGTEMDSTILRINTTWTKQFSPYSFNGPVGVDQGVTLTIEPGVTVLLHNYYLRVNGTLSAKGTSDSRIQFARGELIFTSTSSGWNEQNGSGNIIAQAVLEQTRITSANAIKMENNEINANLEVGNHSIVSNSIIGFGYQLMVGESSQIVGNTISSPVWTGDNVLVSQNIFNPPANHTSTSDDYELATGRNCTITHNTITGINVRNVYSVETNALRASYLSKISDNSITGRITGSPSEITGNNVEGGGTETSFDFRSTDPSYAISIDSSCTFSYNVIAGKTGAAVSAKNALFTSNIIIGTVRVSNSSTFRDNTVNGSINIGVGPHTVSGNRINGRVACANSNCDISDNTIIYGGIDSPAGTIQNNVIENSQIAIYVDTGHVAIVNNTITGNQVGIIVGSAAPEIHNNNIFENIQNTIFLKTSSDVDASYNWWGTTDTDAINKTIFDSKKDFNLGTVTFLPLLQDRNTQAEPRQLINPNPSPSPIETSPSIPELPFSIVLVVFVAASLSACILLGRKLRRVQ
jgi:hypothetical protein